MADTFTGTPEWYGGDQGIIKRLAERAERDYQEGYKPYRFPEEFRAEERVAPFQPLQDIGFRQALDEAEKTPFYERMFGESAGAVRNALGQNITPQLQPYIQRGTANPVEAARQYMNPYNQAVIENIGKYGSRNLLENILPNVQDQFVRAGQYGSSRHQDLTNRAIRDTQEAIAREQANALRGGYSEALQTAEGQQEKQLQGGQLLGGALGRDIERQIIGGRELQNLGESQQQARQRGIGFLGQIGGVQQQQRQNVLNTAYEDAMRQRDYPYQQLARTNALVRGLPVNEFTAQRSYLPQPPSASPWTQGAGLLAGLAGGFGQRQGYAHGGEVIKHKSKIRHYADGGGVPTNPIQLGVNDALDTTELNFIRDQAAKLAQPQIDPFWAGITRAGLNLAANPYADKGFSKLGQAANVGFDEYQNQLAHQDQRNMGAVKLHDMIEKTRQWQMKHNLDTKKFEHDIDYHKEKLGLEKSKLGMEQSKLDILQDKLAMEQEEHEQEKGLVKGAGNMMYQLNTNEKGNKIAVPLEGMNYSPQKTTKQINEEKKANEEALQEWSGILSTAKEEENLLNQIEDINKKLGTKGYESFLSDNGLTEPIANFLKSLRAGKTNIDKMRSLSERLAALRIGRIKGRGNTVAHQMTIKATKPQEKYEYKANVDIIKNDKKDLKYKVGEADFGTKMLNKYKDPNTGIPTFSSSQLKRAYKDWYDSKGKQNGQSPEDFLEAQINEQQFGVAANPNDNQQDNNDFVSNLTEEQKKARAAVFGG